MWTLDMMAVFAKLHWQALDYLWYCQETMSTMEVTKKVHPFQPSLCRAQSEQLQVQHRSGRPQCPSRPIRQWLLGGVICAIIWKLTASRVRWMDTWMRGCRCRSTATSGMDSVAVLLSELRSAVLQDLSVEEIGSDFVQVRSQETSKKFE